MRNRCIAAFTAQEDTPAFINISQNDTEVTVMVRSSGKDGQTAATVSSITMSREDFTELLADIDARYQE